MKAEEIVLPFEQRRRINWTSSSTFMRLDGILEAFCESRKGALTSHNGLHHIGADIREVKQVPEGCRQATVFFFRESFFDKYLPGFLLGRGGMRAWAMSRPKVGLEATHAPQRTISCPVQEGEAGFVPWLRSVFVALQAGNYSPNGVTRKRGVDHVSMTVGDIIKIGEKLFVVGLDGFYVISTLDDEANIRRLEETPSENAFGVLPPGLPPLSPVPALTPEMAV